MFVITHVLPTGYQSSNDREELQQIVDDLNRDALISEEQDRWIVVHADIQHALLNPTTAACPGKTS
jgi:DNA invertase Pin-like site-specific DNA recombinase